jgi:serine/threonine-protein kinase
VYALGIIMYEVFTGRVPFEADTYMGVLTQHMFVKPQPPSAVSPAARELGALEEITLRALEKKPEDRYASMEELGAAIDGVVRFDADGSVQIARSTNASRPPPRPVFKMANELEPPTMDEVRAAIDSAVPLPPRRPLWLMGVVAVCVTALLAVGLLVVLKPKAPDAPVAAAAVMPTPSAPTVAVPPPSRIEEKPVRVIATPAAQVYRGDALIGTTPVELKPGSYTLRAAGHIDQPLTIDRASGPDVTVELTKAAPPPQPPKAQKPAAASPRPTIADDEDPWKRRPR